MSPTEHDDGMLASLSRSISHALHQSRGIQLDLPTPESMRSSGENSDNEPYTANFVAILDSFIQALSRRGHRPEAEAIQRAKDIALEPKSLGGLDIAMRKPLDQNGFDSIVFWVEAWLQSLSSAEKSRRLQCPLPVRPSQRRGMTLTEKILAHHSIGSVSSSGLAAGDFVRVVVDWVAASEISYFSMTKTLSQLDSYTIWRNDRFWLAGDHVVDPRTYDTPLNRRLINAAEQVAHKFRLTDYKGPNYTIMHTEFVRERAEPGMIVVGADSHTCSSGAVGCLAVGLGAADVAMSLVTGETWFKVPECVQIRFVGQPQLGIGGKDIILHILGELKRNTVAAEKVVEFSGPGCQYLSVDARFAISNMCTEFGAITGIFVPDSTVQAYISGRKHRNRKSSSVYFRPDPDATYSEEYDIDLADVKPLLAIYPSPDDVVPVTNKAGLHLDGCFIGACTTTEEDLVLAGLVLEVGLRWNLPLVPGKRHVTPGSIPIRSRLEALGLLDIFKSAGFSIGAPGCSYCVGMGADQAGEGEVWLSSQNRNFKNRMGKGAMGNLSSAATVAASSFAMRVADPSPFIAEVEAGYFDAIKAHPLRKPSPSAVKETKLAYVEPHYHSSAGQSFAQHRSKAGERGNVSMPSHNRRASIVDKVIRLGDFVDTDQIAPADCLVTATTDEDLGDHCMKYTMPQFRAKVRDGLRVVVAGKAVGVGSSREAAVRAFKGELTKGESGDWERSIYSHRYFIGLGVRCVIGRSFAFIFGRNLPNMGILRFVIDDDVFYEAAVDGVEIQISLDDRQVQVGELTFHFQLSDMELALIENQGMTSAYQKFGKDIFHSLSGGKGIHEFSQELVDEKSELPAGMRDLQW
ncbi:aconitase family protein [Penicillium hispanicum]|uniref:aconitase family protein n=1 Tax=Penicillium hispanicum TaxID=1080232 RepID=UPI002541191F|nr:aconitase family protein [Penicillium hispanicum]KAJ5587977.1 aconitase family protein [Penicillium hispanicum]